MTRRRGLSLSVMWGDRLYPSKRALARHKGVSVTTVIRWLRRGYTCDDDVRRWHVECEWNDTQYPTIEAARKAEGVSWTAMRERVARGYTCDDDLRKVS